MAEELGLGIVNISSTCYLGAFLTCLMGGCSEWLLLLQTAATPFVQALELDLKNAKLGGRDLIITPQATFAWYQRIAPHVFQDPRRRGHAIFSQDPNELLLMMLSEFDTAVTPTLTDPTLLKKITASFSLLSLHMFTCEGCGHKFSTPTQPLHALNLPMTASFRDSLSSALQTERLVGYRCEACYVHTHPHCKGNPKCEPPEARSKTDFCSRCHYLDRLHHHITDPALVQTAWLPPTTLKTTAIEFPLPSHVLILNVLHTAAGQRLDDIELTLMQHYHLQSFSVWTGGHHLACWRLGEQWMLTNDSQCTHHVPLAHIQKHWLPQAHQLFYVKIVPTMV
jgi:hypothetical protein